MRKMTSTKILLYVIIGYLALVLIIFLSQRKLLYLPSKAKTTIQQAERQGLKHWPNFQQHRGFINIHAPATPSGTLIVFHGNAGSASHRSYYSDALTQQGFRTIIAEYPGYGGRAGSPSEQDIVADANKTLHLVHEAFGEPLFLWGESLGSGVAAAVIAKTSIPIRGLVLLTPWDSLAEIAQTHYWYLPARHLVLDKYDSTENLKNFGGHIAVILAERDEVIPAPHGQRLFDAITSNKQLWHFPDARHNTWPIEPHAPWWQEVTQFLTQDSLSR